MTVPPPPPPPPPPPHGPAAGDGYRVGAPPTTPTVRHEFADGPRTSGGGLLPGVWLVLAIVAAAAGALVALLLGSSIGLAVAAWVAAGPVAIVLLAAYRLSEARSGAAGMSYSQPPWVPVLYWTAIVVIIVGIGCGAWRIADWVGRL